VVFDVGAAYFCKLVAECFTNKYSYISAIFGSVAFVMTVAGTGTNHVCTSVDTTYHAINLLSCYEDSLPLSIAKNCISNMGFAVSPLVSAFTGLGLFEAFRYSKQHSINATKNKLDKNISELNLRLK